MTFSTRLMRSTCSMKSRVKSLSAKVGGTAATQQRGQCGGDDLADRVMVVGRRPVERREHRITSYNVCYTKLLRTPGARPRASQLSAVTTQVTLRPEGRARVTSLLTGPS